jgi:hypothetical protein
MIENQDTTYKLYKVYDIQRVKNGFVVVLCDEVNNYYFDVASLKANFKFKAKIKKGESYYFALFPYFNKTYTPNHAVNYNVKIKNKVIVVKSKSWTGNVYTTPNLDGLYYLPLNK